MKKYLLKTSVIIVLAIIIHSKTSAQDTPPPPPPPVIERDEAPVKAKANQEIIIKKKNEKDIKLTVEVKDGKVFINGKPADDFNDDNVTVHFGDNDFVLSPDINMRVSPFRGGWNYNGDENLFLNENAKTAFLGVTTEDAENGNGAKINEVTKGSAAEKAGLKTGDIITKIDDTKIGKGELTETVRKYKPEDKVTVTYIRDGKEQKTTATLGKLRQMKMKTFSMAMPKMNQSFNYNGDNFYSFSYAGKAKLGIKAQDLEEGKGAKVLDVDDESPADKAGIKEGDIITEFEGKPVENADDLAKLAHENKEKYTYKIKLTRDGKSQEVQVKIPKKLKTADL